MVCVAFRSALFISQIRTTAVDLALLVFDFRRQVFVLAAIQDIDIQRPILRVVSRRHIQVLNSRTILDFVGRRRDKDIERCVSTLLSVLHDREIRRLQKQSLLVCHDRSDDVYHLGQVGHLHNVGVAKERVEKHSHRQAHLQSCKSLPAFRDYRCGTKHSTRRRQHKAVVDSLVPTVPV